MRWLRLLAFWLALALPAGTSAQAPPNEAPPPSVEELLRLLGEPEVQSWLAERAPARASPAPTAARAGLIAEAEAEVEAVFEEIELAAAVARWQAHRDTLLAALPNLPAELARGIARLTDDAGRRGVVVLLITVFVAAGFVAEWAFVRATRTIRRRVLTADETTVKERLQKAAMRLGLVLGAVVVFAAASLGIFLMVDLPPLVREVAGRFLFAFIVFRLIRYVARLILAPTAARLRIMPVDDDAARFWLARISAFVGVFAFGWATASSFIALGVIPPHPTIVAYVLGLGLVAVAIETIWRRPQEPAQGAPRTLSGPPIAGLEGALVESGAAPGTAVASEPAGEAVVVAEASPTPVAGSRTVGKLALTAFAILVFLLWLIDARPLMWLALIGSALVMALNVVCYSVNNLLRPIGQVMDQEEGPPSVLAAAIERGARALMIVGAVLLLLWAWGIDIAALTGDEASRNPLVVALINIAIIVIVVDFIWHVGHTAIDRYITEADSGTAVGADEVRRRARLRTLLPIGRNVLQVVLAVTAILMILASMGVQIAPLIAGAGVVGVAIGFGSQTLVRDLMSGMFYLLDDAFRVGEYIVADRYKGTVESFSLRSIKLRHHRGPLFTIPFGSLGAIQNMSREWVIVKTAFTVPFDTDINKVKKVIKQVNAELMADPELAPGFLEPLKSQGADEIAPHGIVIRVKFKAIPGTQFTIRRRANALIKQAFAEHGIKFAFPTVQVAGSGDEVAAAKAMLDDQAKRAAE